MLQLALLDLGAQDLVAILTDPGGPVLPTHSWQIQASRSCCDPHRPRRAGAAHRRDGGRLPDPAVAILTDPGGPVLHLAGGQAERLPDRVAILTDPGGPVLPLIRHIMLRWVRLRSSPTPEGRCCPAGRAVHGHRHLSCDPHRPRRAGAAPPQPGDDWAGPVAILTDPGGPVLLTSEARCRRPHRPRSAARPRCDPHRPRRAGAAPCPRNVGVRIRRLRSSPTPEGRCCGL